MGKCVLRLFLFFVILFPLGVYSQDYYFVSGTDGNWNNLQNWRTSSGGSVAHTSLPSAEDNVVIDENSFSGTIHEIVLEEDVGCKDITLTAQDEFTFRLEENAALTITGSLSGTSHVTYDIAGDLSLEGSGDKIIDFGQDVDLNRLTIGDADGKWELRNSLYIENELKMTEGNISFRDIDIDAVRAEFNPESQLTVNFENVNINLRSTGKREDASSIRSSLYFAKADHLELNISNTKFYLEGDYPSILLTGAGTISLDQIHINATENGRIENFSDSEININTLYVDGAMDFIYSTGLSVHEININAGSTVLLGEGITYKWNEIHAVGTCNNFIQISSNHSEIETQKTEMEYAILLNITFKGNATAQNTSLLGNSSGVELSPSDSRILYWIGGSGDWNDPNNWSFSSGGGPANCIPSGIDDVIFDDQSFEENGETVTVQKDAFAKNFKWQVSGDIQILFPISQGHRLFINGSMIVEHKTLQFNDSRGTIQFVTNENSILDTKDIFIAGHVSFNGPGTWTLESGLSILGTTNFNSGKLILNKNQLTSSIFFSLSLLPREIDMSDSRWLIRSGANSSLRLYWDDLTLNTDRSHLHISSGDEISIHSSEDNLNPEVLFDSISVESQNLIFNVSSSNLILKCNYLNLIRNTSFSGKFEAREVIFHQMQKYEFIGGAILDAISVKMEDECEEGVLFYSKERSQPGVLHFPADTEIPRLMAQNIHVNSGNILAPGGVDNGNNKGIEFEEGNGRVLYWIGGSGNWHDKQNWSTSSGGEGGACPPGIRDDVVFDENSFQSSEDRVISSQIKSAICHDFTFHSRALSDQLNVDLYLHGSMTLEKTIGEESEMTLFCMSLEEEVHQLHNSQFEIIEIIGPGIHNFDGNIRIRRSMDQHDGTLNLQNGIIQTRYFYIRKDVQNPVTLDHAILQFYHELQNTLNIFSSNSSFEVKNIGDSYIEYLGPKNNLTVNRNTHLGKVIFQNP